MNRSHRGVLVAALLAGGCMKEERFVEEYNEAACAWLSDCNGAVEEQTCREQADATQILLPQACEYHPKQARRCVDGMWNLECPSQTVDVTLPAACDLVWEC